MLSLAKARTVFVLSDLHQDGVKLATKMKKTDSLILALCRISKMISFSMSLSPYFILYEKFGTLNFFFLFIRIRELICLIRADSSIFG
jgi:hypothetical protein